MSRLFKYRLPSRTVTMIKPVAKIANIYFMSAPLQSFRYFLYLYLILFIEKHKLTLPFQKELVNIEQNEEKNEEKILHRFDYLCRIH